MQTAWSRRLADPVVGGATLDRLVERAERLKREQADFFERYRPEARQVLDALVEKYAEHGAAQFQLPEILEAPPFNEWGNVIEIAARFGGGDRLRGAVDELQRRLYVA